MKAVWMLLLLLPGSGGFMIHNLHRSLCVQDSPDSGMALLRTCDLDSELQQWQWSEQGLLRCVATSRCLSGRNAGPVRTEACQEVVGASVGLEWDCDRDRLINKNTSLLLAVHRGRLSLTDLNPKPKHATWRSLDGGDICQEKLRSRRASDDAQDYEDEEQQKLASMTEEQRQLLMWFYRTEDPTMWKFAMLGLAFVCLLVGFLLLGMGCMANKNRKKIAKYKVAAARAQQSELQELQESKEEASTPDESLLKSSPSNGEAGELRPGNIVVTWKNGNTSSLYPEAEVAEEEQNQDDHKEETQGENGEENQKENQEENQEEKQEENQEEKQEENQEETQEENQEDNQKEAPPPGLEAQQAETMTE